MRVPLFYCALLFALSCQQEPLVDPGAADLAAPPEHTRALSAREHRSTIAALFGAPLADDLALPADARVDGFDNQQAGFAPSSVWVAAYDAAAEEIARRALAQPTPRERLPPTPVPTLVGPEVSDLLNWEGRLTLPSDGVYRLTFTGEYGGATQPVQRRLMVDGEHAAWITFAASGVDVQTTEVALTAGVRTFDLWTPRTDPGAEVAAALSMAVTLEGPVDPDPTHNPARDALLRCDLAAQPCLRETLERWLPQAWRRPVEAAEVDALVALAEGTLAAGASPDDALADALHAALSGPSFLLHAEPGPWGLASRLSSLAWAAPPDDALRARVEELGDPAVVREELARLLADPRAAALVDGFAWQWLELDRMDDMTPALMLFPDFDAELRDAMKEQARRMLQRFLLGPEPLRGLVDTPVAWVDTRLAAHEGTAGTGEVDRSAGHRFGLEGLSGVEAMLSHPDRTSPTRRGAWLLDKLLCDAPGAPPEGLPPLPQDTGGALTLEERLAQHASDPGCASCHARTDPPGLALEGFDAVGHWREGFVAHGAMPDGTPIESPEDLATWLAASPLFEACVAKKAFTWAVGRPPAAEELDPVVAAWRGTDGTFGALLAEIVTTPAFRGAP